MQTIAIHMKIIAIGNIPGGRLFGGGYAGSVIVRAVVYGATRDAGMRRGCECGVDRPGNEDGRAEARGARGGARRRAAFLRTTTNRSTLWTHCGNAASRRRRTNSWFTSSALFAGLLNVMWSSAASWFASRHLHPRVRARETKNNATARDRAIK